MYVGTDRTRQPLLAYFVLRNILGRLESDGHLKDIEDAKKKARDAKRHLGGILATSEARSHDEEEDDVEDQHRHARREDLELTPYEQTIAMEVVAPGDIPVTFEGLYCPGVMSQDWY